MKSLRLVFASALLVPLLAGAEEITVWGSSNGEVLGLSGLSFHASEFTASTVNGVGSFVGSNSLGAFSLPGDSPASGSGSFTLRLNLTGPNGIAGGQPVTVFGRIVAGERGVSIHFHRPASAFRFSGANTNGSFSITLADVFVPAGETAPLVAVLSGSQESSSACRLEFTAARATPLFLPRDQKLTPVVIHPTASDGATCGLTCRIDSVSSNEPEADWQVTGDLTLSLRADRRSDGYGRMYIVDVQCADYAGHRVTQKATVTVPRNPGR
jgi:hypothetical protein